MWPEMTILNLFAAAPANLERLFNTEVGATLRGRPHHFPTISFQKLAPVL
jgi:hypothetical protein